MTTVTSLNSANVEHVTNGDARSSATGRFELTLPEPSFCGDPVAGALAAIAKFVKSSRELSRTTKAAKDALRAKNEAGEISALREKASAVRSAAVVSACVLGASAGLHATGFGVSTSNPQSATLKPLDGAADVCARGSDIPTKLGEAAATEHEADAREAASRAKTAGTEAENAADNAKAADELVRKAYDAIKAIVDLRHATELAIINRRA